MRRMILSLLLICALGIVPAWAQFTNPESPAQGANLLNSSTTSGVASTLTKTLTGATGQRVHLSSLAVYCSAGTASLTIADGVTTIWSSPSGFITTTMVSLTWPVPLASTTGNNMTVTVTSCGGGATSTLAVSSHRF